MAGIYIHIPFCKSRCIYCGFFSSTHQELRQRYVDALCQEMHLRRDYLGGAPVTTVYLGGGTPSQLSGAQLDQLFTALSDTFPMHAVQEVTIECNPDDVTADFAALLSRLPVNRVSMGAQTFSDARLRFLRRRHTAAQVGQAAGRLRRAGIGNVSIDLMYGFPGETLADWHRDIQQALALHPEHLSAYALSFEEGTPLFTLLEQGKVETLDEELQRQMYYDLADHLDAAGYEHYELSNFALLPPGSRAVSPFRSRHNSSYWDQTPYLGLGAAAHSYDGDSRQWNVADVGRYIEGIQQQKPLTEREQLDAPTRYNDLVMTALRTREGIALRLLSPAERNYCLRNASRYVADGLLVCADDHLRLSRKALFVSNMIMADLMMV